MGNACMSFIRTKKEKTSPGFSKADNIFQPFTFHDLVHATNNFDEARLIGSGDFGRVYLGLFKMGLFKRDQVVAVKRLNQMGEQGDREFIREGVFLSSFQHANIIKLVGYCSEGVERLIVSEYMSLGSLDRHLHDLPPNRQPLSWSLRIKVAAGLASALSFLHNLHRPVVHLGVNSSNVLLHEDYHPKLSDFGYSGYASVELRSTDFPPNDGYKDPRSENLDTMFDVYSFGVLLLELVSARRAIDSRGDRLTDWAIPLLKSQKHLLVDPLLNSHFSKHQLFEVLRLAEQCLGDVGKRPSMADVSSVVENLIAEGEAASSNALSPGVAASGGASDSSVAASGGASSLGVAASSITSASGVAVFDGASGSGVAASGSASGLDVAAASSTSALGIDASSFATGSVVAEVGRSPSMADVSSVLEKLIAEGEAASSNAFAPGIDASSGASGSSVAASGSGVAALGGAFGLVVVAFGASGSGVAASGLGVAAPSCA